MLTAEILSTAASILIFASTFPQIRQTLRTRLTRDLSLVNLIMCVAGLSVWTTYAVYTFQPIFAIGDGVDMAMWATVLAIKVNNVVKKKEGPKKEITYKSEYCRKNSHIYFGKFDRCLICNEEK